MFDLTKTATLTLGLFLACAAQAQEATTTPEAPAADAAATEAPATDAAATDAPAADGAAAEPAGQATGGLSMGQEVPADGQAAPQDGPGSVYIAGKHGDWEQRCVKAQDGSDPCQLYQLLKDPSGNPVAEISLFGLPKTDNGPAAGATIIAPLETLLTENLVLQVDEGKAKVYPFTFCTREGCVARLGLTGAEIDAFKKGNKAKITIVPVVAPDQKVLLEVSLSGFTAGYDAVNTANAPAAAGN
jgi:invasion protein IalB